MYSKQPNSIENNDGCYDLLNLEQCCFLDDPRGGAFASFFSPT